MSTAAITRDTTKLSPLVRILGFTLFFSAFLLFWCEPMVGKMALPYAGGAASVWTVCVLFFQITLLAAYLYAHLLGRLPGVPLQLTIHGMVLLTSIAFLPIHFRIESVVGENANPALWFAGHLAAVAGMPFFAVATTAPLLQRWFSTTSEASAKDPYFLYAASNAGSLLALGLHPFVLEPLLGASVQARLWFVGYALLVLMITITTILVLRQSTKALNSTKESRVSSRPRVGMRLFWVASAFVPSALMLAVTNHLTTNLASAPFLWVIPLATYLLTFILPFSRKFAVASQQAGRALPAVLLLMLIVPVVLNTLELPGTRWFVMATHIVLLFFSALLCHAAIAKRRPAADHLTEFYFWIALGGVLGGAFTALLAPMIFRTVFEYPLLVAIVSFFRTSSSSSKELDRKLWALPAGMGAAAALCFLLFSWLRFQFSTSALIIAAAMFLVAIYQLRNEPVVFAVSSAIFIMILAIVVPRYVDAPVVYVTRNFFGVKKVLDDPNLKRRELVHGDTMHGLENLAVGLSGQPLSYFHRMGPAGDVMATMSRKPARRWGVIGLGAGSMAAYTDSGSTMTFFEIDPDVEFVARRYFTFLGRCGTQCRVVVGDGRLELEKLPEGQLDLLMLDAFSSDAIPAHLLSREAVQLYLSRLAPDGVILFHVSNRYLDVPTVVSSLIQDAALVGLIKRDPGGTFDQDGRAASIHIVAARKAEDLGDLTRVPGWEPVHAPRAFRVWTDDYSNLMGIVNFR